MVNRNSIVKERDIFNNPIVILVFTSFVLTTTVDVVLEKGLVAGVLTHCVLVACLRLGVQTIRDWTRERRGAKRGK